MPTRKSQNSLYNRIVEIGANAGSDDLRLTYRPASDDFDAMMQEVDRWDREVSYSVTQRRTCYDFCGAVSNQGGSRAGAFSFTLNPDDIDASVDLTIENLQNWQNK